VSRGQEDCAWEGLGRTDKADGQAIHGCRGCEQQEGKQVPFLALQGRVSLPPLYVQLCWLCGGGVLVVWRSVCAAVLVVWRRSVLQGASASACTRMHMMHAGHEGRLHHLRLQQEAPAQDRPPGRLAAARPAAPESAVLQRQGPVHVLAQDPQARGACARTL